MADNSRGIGKKGWKSHGLGISAPFPKWFHELSNTQGSYFKNTILKGAIQYIPLQLKLNDVKVFYSYSSIKHFD